MSDRAAKHRLFDKLAAVAKAAGHGRRAEILDLLSQGPRSVDGIAAELGIPVANASHHLRTLAAAGLLRTRKDGTRVEYSLAGDSVAALWRTMRDVAAEHVAEIDRLATDYLGDRSRLETIARAELARRLRRGDVVVIDVRPAAEFEAGHVRGARSIPVRELSRRLRELPKDTGIVAYCRGPYCVYADDAVRTLTKKGFVAARLEDGFPEWRDAGLPVASGGGR